jgi:hypothetical protein
VENRYERLWTIGRLLELSPGEIDATTVEPFGDDPQGIEFVAVQLIRNLGRSKRRVQGTLAD